MREHVHSPSQKGFNSRQEAICLLPTTSSDSSEPLQRYTMLMPSRTNSPAVTADQLRYVQIHNTPTHMPQTASASSGRIGKKVAPCVSWRVEPHECHTYSPELDDRSEQALVQSALVDLSNGYARLGKDVESNAMVTYDHLMHRYSDSGGVGVDDGTLESCDFSNSVI